MNHAQQTLLLDTLRAAKRRLAIDSRPTENLLREARAHFRGTGAPYWQRKVAEYERLHEAHKLEREALHHSMQIIEEEEIKN